MNHFRFIADTKLAYILYVLCLFLFAIGCGGKDDPETETSSLVFGIRMSASDRLKDNLYTIKAAADNQITADTNNSIAFDCSQIGVHTVTAYIYNAENRLLIIGGPWLCSEHGGEIGSIPSGPDRRVIIEGRDEEGNIIVYGEKYVGTLLPNETSEAGIIKVYHFAVTDTRPENDVMISSSTVLLEWEPIPGAVRYHLQVSGTSDFSALIVDDDTLTTTSYLHTNASEKTTYYWRISAVDINDNKSSNSTGRTYHISEKITCFADMDRDGFGNPEESIKSFDVPDGYVEDNNDCNDSNASIHPGMAETYDDIDNNCSGENNEGFSAYYQDADHDGYGNLNIVIYKIEAPEGYVPDSTDFDDTDATRYPGAPELYDQKDNDGDGAVDEGFLPWYQDADNDGYGDAGNIRYAIVKPSGYVNNSNDCNDRNMSIHPGANEICGDSIDQNCDGGDEICPVPEPPTAQYPYYRDVDGDGYGNAAVVVYQTSQPDGYVANNTDCNDNDAGIHPGAEELYDDVDNNCSGENNEGFSAWYEDGDGDEYGNADMVVYQTSQPEGYVADNTDCDDNDAGIHPGAEELYDDVDNNCSGENNEGFSAWYEDGDGDEYGNADMVVYQTSQPEGYVSDNTDCDDDDPQVYPGYATWYRDADDDSYSSGETDDVSCLRPEGYKHMNELADDIWDCDDQNPEINPGAVEDLNDLADSNCNGGYELRDPSLDVRIRWVIANALYESPNEYFSGEIFDEHLENWSELNIAEHDIESLEGIQNFTNITHLGISWGPENSLDCTPVGSLVNLQELDLSGNLITDISALETLTGLTRLTLNDNAITDISPIDNLTHLQYLYLGSNTISDIGALETLTGLRMLRLDDNEISDLVPLANLTNLSLLNLYYNNVTDISPLAALTELNSLNLSFNTISDLTALVSLTKLYIVNLSSNAIIDIFGLVDNRGLSQGDSVDLRENPGNDVAFWNNVEELQGRGVTVYVGHFEW